MTAKKKKSKKRMIITIVVVVLLAALVLSFTLLGGGGGDPLANVKTVAATSGAIEKTVSGTGNISSNDTTQDIIIEAGLSIDQVMVENGDKVVAGDILATFDPAVLQKAIWTAQSDLDKLDVQLNQLRNKTESITIPTAVAGRVKQIFAVAGEAVRETMARDGALMMLSLDGKLLVTFAPAMIDGLAVGSAVTVTLSDGSTATGTVRALSATVCTVSISDQTAPVGDPVKVTKADGSALGEGQLVISQPLAITGTDGTVDRILRALNASVKSGTKLIELQDAPTSRQYSELYVSRQDKAASLATLMTYVKQNALISPYTGTISLLNLAEGQTTGSASASAASATAAAGNLAAASSAAKVTAAANVACVIATANDIRLTVPIDELDIAVLAVDQKAAITLDALTGKSFSGTILEIAETGIIGQGGTTFEVTLDLPEDTALKLGMTATAVITIERREGIVRIPMDALQELGGEQFVYVGTPTDATHLGQKRPVVVGISDGQYVEIRSGLNAGETINYYYVSSSSLFPFGGGMGYPGTTTASTTK